MVAIASLIGFFATAVFVFGLKAAGLGGFAPVLLIGIGWFQAIAIHEFGHVAAALLVNWRVWIVSAVPFCVRVHTPVALRPTSTMRQDAGGYVLTSPTSALRDTKLRSVAVTLGGPLASLMAFIAFTAVGSTSWSPAVGHWPDASIQVIFAFGIFSFAIALSSAWPVTAKDGRLNDGAKILATTRETRRSDHALQIAAGLLQYGIEPSAWDDWLRDAVVAHSTSPFGSPVGTYLGFALALDRHDLDAARAVVTNGQRQGGALAASVTNALQAYLAACVDENMVAAEAHAINSGAGNWPEPAKFRELALVAILVASGETAQASTRLARFENDLRHKPFPQPFWERLAADARRKLI
jgi:hypothetical protein